MFLGSSFLCPHTAFHLRQLAFLVHSCTSPFVTQHPDVKKAQDESCHRGLHGLVGDKRVSLKGAVSEVAWRMGVWGEPNSWPPSQGLQTQFRHLLTVWPWHQEQLMEPLILVHTSEKWRLCGSCLVGFSECWMWGWSHSWLSETRDTCPPVTRVPWSHKKKSLAPGKSFALSEWGQDGTVPFEKKRRKNSTSLATFVSQSYILFSGSDGNTSLIEGENNEHILILGKIFKMEGTRHSFSAYKKHLKKKTGTEKMLFV